MNKNEAAGALQSPAPATVTYNGLTFVPYISRKDISKRVSDIAASLSSRFAGRVPLVVCVLNGAFPFASDIFRSLTIDAEIAFVRLKSYDGMASTGSIKQLQGLSENIEGRDVIIIEDIIDTGRTMNNLLKDLSARSPRSLSVATLLFKPDALLCDIKPDYVGFEIPSKFIIGYGLDLDGLARNLPDIWVLSGKDTVESK
ncbi:MAG: hypoxanthine phosphoribosyltransferase [Bacteroides sp.]|nr:hypoxanthine phosphoribosyltransferase [Bacteroides sp.]